MEKIFPRAEDVLNQEEEKVSRVGENTTIMEHFFTAWKVFQYGVFSGPYFPVFGLNTEIYSRSTSVFVHFSRSDIFMQYHQNYTRIFLR